MKARLGKCSWPALAAAILCLTATTAGAYILRGPHLLELMVRQIGRPDTLLVIQRVTYHDSPSAAGVVEARETLRYVFPGTLRSDSRSANAERIRIEAQGQSLTIVDGRIGVADKYPFDLYTEILLYRSRKLLAARLAHLGVDVNATSYARFQDGIVLVLGTEKQDPHLSQVWFDKETFLPVRWLMPGRDGDGREFMREIRYNDWRQVNSAWYPMHLQFFQDERLVREIRVEQMTVNPEFPGELFDLARLRSAYRTENAEAVQKGVSDELDEVQETIDEFRKKYEE